MRLHLGFVTKKSQWSEGKTVSGAKMGVAKAKEAANSEIGNKPRGVLPFFGYRSSGVVLKTVISQEVSQ